MDAEKFDAAIAEWLRYQASPRGRLRTVLLTAGLRPHLPGAPCDVLDIGGGLGELSAELARAGHRVTLADYSRGMLDAARERFAAENLRFELADLDADSRVFAPDGFDLILCHNALEYARDPGAALDRVLTALRPGGAISLVFGNACHAPLQSALIHRDPARAMRELVGGQVESTNIFGTHTHMLDPFWVKARLTAARLDMLAFNGIRCVSDLIEKGYADDEAHFAALLELERALMTQPAYRAIARFTQLIARR